MKKICCLRGTKVFSVFARIDRHLSFVVTDGRVHLLLVDVLDLGDGAAQDTLLLLFGQRLGHHLNGLGPLVSAGHKLRCLNITAAQWIHLNH